MVSKEALVLPGQENFKVHEDSNLARVLETLEDLQRAEKILIANNKPLVKINPESNWAEWIEYFVAPPEGIFNADRLNSFRQNLFPHMKPGLNSPVYQTADGLHLGYVAFDDKLVRRNREITDAVQEEFEPGAAERLGLKLEEPIARRSDDTLSRRTFVKVYPHILLAEVVARMKREGTHYSSLYFTRLEDELSKPQQEVLKVAAQDRYGHSGRLFRIMQSVARREEAEAHSQYLR
ncbi:hypothetical protein A3A54_00225 [Candidatus Curtissbacteria bacterium RIFCSPLOWO2_01_FULL_39_62]|uniref:Uncharacterized protein n=2 Tax=Candidatus Curtissiibacteriota TaxID=1752717 RepID=A0A1F5GAN9_9BACT|nr:MAG: hypothetical protein A2775_00855 [Candidatus Curtissbacteria bacterium RIFCSPHIGHO2_01_FULL_39_57]OGD88943.1 MAG: hypothetical protein A3D04_01975 [Candidatus Curtissbacteria bacterium RIFCSPHIGHO2_02_FULL_40_16b]OGD90693.1 MAG: hypothetical protein A3E11_00970 [Candidatus Curtissbacteria bacterium RIFCSPHIGHO2_12_FULL_38_37]OGE00718.1 MAG: hypothetical protein A3J17_04160 [Candidatus Curtissbacteria bacterium RIFCSPLOWO2_02_FULL_40_11]OGE02442.1 MAG: hypothetical protein A3A54_00225 [C